MGSKLKAGPEVAAILSFVLWVILLLPLAAVAKEAASTEKERVAKLIEGAKSEGALVFYGTMDVSHTMKLFDRFKEKYPFIKTELYRASSPQLLSKLMSEAKAKRYIPDIIQLTGFQAYVSKKEGLSLGYVSPESAAYREGFKDQEGHWTSIYILHYAMGFNTRLLSRKDIPDHYEGFLQPRWKGKKICFDTQEVEWYANMMKIMGEAKGTEFMKKFAAQDLLYRSGHTLTATLVAAGELPLATVYPQGAEAMKKNGAPMEWVGVAPLIVKLGAIGIAAHAPHPNAAKLFIDFSLSKEGQTIIRSTGRVPARPDVEIDYMKHLEGIKLYPSDLSLATNYAKYHRQFNELFRFK